MAGPRGPLPLLLLLLGGLARSCDAVCVVRADNGEVVTNVCGLILLFIVLSLGDMLRDTRPRNDVVVFVVAIGLLAASAVCGGRSAMVMDALSWLLVGTIAALLALQLVCSGWWWSRDHRFLMVLYSFNSPRLNLVVVFAAVYHQLALVASPLLYFTCVLYLAVSLILVGQPSKYSKYLNPRGHRMAGHRLPRSATGWLERLFGWADDGRGVYAAVAATPTTAAATSTSATVLEPDLERNGSAGGCQAEAIASPSCYRAGAGAEPEADAEPVSGRMEVEDIMEGVMGAIHTSRGGAPRRTSEGPPRPPRHRVQTSGFWLALLRLAAAAVAVAMFVTLCVLWATDPLLECYDSSGSGPWEFATTQGSWPILEDRPALFMVERPFVALGGSGVLYRVDVVSAAQYEHPTTPCPAEQAYSLPVDVSAPDGSVHVVGALRFSRCLWMNKYATLKDAYFDVDIPLRYVRRVQVTQREASPAWYGNESEPYVGLVMGLVINTYGKSYTAAWRVYARPEMVYLPSPLPF